MAHTKAMEFFASGDFIVPDNVHAVRVTAIGGGSGGAGTYQTSPNAGGQGGSSGEMVVGFRVKVTPGATIPVVVGAGGPYAHVWPTDLSGTPGGDSSFGHVIALGGRRLYGGGPAGGKDATDLADNNGIGYFGELDSPLHFGGSGMSKGGYVTPTDGVYGPGDAGYAVGGAFGVLYSTAGGGSGGAATPWGIGGVGGRGYGLGGSAHDSSGDTGGSPAITNGNPAPTTSYGSGGGGAGGCYSAYSAKLIWGGAGAPGYVLVEWVE